MDTIENCRKGNKNDTIVNHCHYRCYKNHYHSVPFILQTYHQHLHHSLKLYSFYSLLSPTKLKFQIFFYGITKTGTRASRTTLSVTLPNVILSMVLCLPEEPKITKSIFSSSIVLRISI